MTHTFHPHRAIACAVAACLAHGVAHAQPASAGDPAAPAGDQQQGSAALAEARKLFEEGNADYSAGRYALAAERFSRAYQLSGHPALLFNLANTYERAGDYEKAAHYLRMYLEGGSVQDTGSVKARLQRLELAVVELQDRQEQPERENPTSETRSATPSPAPAAPAAEDGHRPSRAPYLIAAGGLVAGAAVSITFGLRARSERDAIDSHCNAGLCQDGAQSHFDSERRDALVSDIGTGLAVASAAGALIYFLATRNSDTESTRPSLSLVPSTAAEGVGVVAFGHF